MGPPRFAVPHMSLPVWQLSYHGGSQPECLTCWSRCVCKGQDWSQLLLFILQCHWLPLSVHVLCSVEQGELLLLPNILCGTGFQLSGWIYSGHLVAKAEVSDWGTSKVGWKCSFKRVSNIRLQYSAFILNYCPLTIWCCFAYGALPLFLLSLGFLWNSVDNLWSSIQTWLWRDWIAKNIRAISEKSSVQLGFLINSWLENQKEYSPCFMVEGFCSYRWPSQITSLSMRNGHYGHLGFHSWIWMLFP